MNSHASLIKLDRYYSALLYIYYLRVLLLTPKQEPLTPKQCRIQTSCWRYGRRVLGYLMTDHLQSNNGLDDLKPLLNGSN